MLDCIDCAMSWHKIWYATSSNNMHHINRRCRIRAAASQSAARNLRCVARARTRACDLLSHLVVGRGDPPTRRVSPAPVPQYPYSRKVLTGRDSYLVRSGGAFPLDLQGPETLFSSFGVNSKVAVLRKIFAVLRSSRRADLNGTLISFYFPAVLSLHATHYVVLRDR